MENQLICTKCKATKSVDEFSKSTRRKSGYQNKCKECFADYYLQNKERIAMKYQSDRTNKKIARANYYKANKISINKKQRAYHANNRDERLAYQKTYYQNNKPKFYSALIQRRKRLVETSKVLTNKDFEKLYSQPCIYCGSNEAVEIDHVVPLARGGSHSIGNLASACRTCNRQKNDKLIMEWRTTR